MENHLKNHLPVTSPGDQSALELIRGEGIAFAPGRFHKGKPVAVIDIGSNSVRLVVYEALSRSPTPIFNEKALCGLGREIATTGRLAADAVDKALASLRRFRALCDMMDVGDLHVLATAAARDASNGDAFISEAQRICRVPVDILSGQREAKLAAYGVVSSIHMPDGIVGDMGGGSVELVEIQGQVVGEGITLPLGGLILQQASGGSMKKAEKVVEKSLGKAIMLAGCRGRTFYAVGGTWRSMARLNMARLDYPLNVMHGYTMTAEEALDLCRLILRPVSNAPPLPSVSDQRQPLIGYGALLLEKIIQIARPKQVVCSALGVREGLLYSLLNDEQRAADPLISAAVELCVLRSRSPKHAEDLILWTEQLFRTIGLAETSQERRLRIAACLLADIGWRAHPDYRGEQSLNIIAHAAVIGADHADRLFLALSVYFRHAGLSEEGLSPRLRALIDPRMLDRAKILGAAMRVAYLLSAAMPGVLPQIGFASHERRLSLVFPRELEQLIGERVGNRLKQLGKILALETDMKTL